MPNEKKIDKIRLSKRPFNILDIAVFAVVILVSVFVMYFSSSSDAKYVEISYQGQVQSYPLDVDAEITIKEGYVVAIENGMCYVKTADCRDKICKHSGAIKRVNQTIICAPHGIIIKIVGRDISKL